LRHQPRANQPAPARARHAPKQTLKHEGQELHAIAGTAARLTDPVQQEAGPGAAGVGRGRVAEVDRGPVRGHLALQAEQAPQRRAVRVHGGRQRRRAPRRRRAAQVRLRGALVFVRAAAGRTVLCGALRAAAAGPQGPAGRPSALLCRA